MMLMTRTDKEARLKDFIVEAFACRGEDPARDNGLTLFVRSPDSPVARALAAACAEGSTQAARIRVLICDTNSDDPAAPSLFDIAGIECRVLADPSFGPAHEQLAIGHTHVWIGDCLRRDPTKRDAFELYHPNDPVIGVFAMASFEKLWVRGRPLPLRDPLSPAIIAAQSDDPNALPRNPRH